MNQVVFVGRLTHDPKLSQTKDGLAVCNFSIAVNRPYKNNDDKVDVDFFKVVAWSALAESCGKYLEKGQMVAVAGRLQNNSYDGKDGTNWRTSELIARNVKFLSKSRQQNQELDEEEGPISTSGPTSPTSSDWSDDIPF